MRVESKRWVLTTTIFVISIAVWTSRPPTVAQTGAPPQKRVRLNRIIERLEQGQPAVGRTHYEWFDMEHNPLNFDRIAARFQELSKQKNADNQWPITPVIRIPVYGDESPRWMVKQILDNGGFSICFPQIDTRQQALRAVQSMRYPPQKGSKYLNPVGIRGFAPKPALWGLELPEYLRRADVWPLNPDGELFAVLMVESAEGLKNVNEIASVPGVGALFIGPYDLGTSLGVGGPREHNTATPHAQETEGAIGTILQACKAHNVICGISADAGGRPEVEARIKQGFKLLLGPPM